MKSYEWDTEVASLLPEEAKKSLEENYLNYVHKIKRDASGNMYLVAEQYKKVTSARGIFVKLLGGLASSSEGKVGNLLIFSINPEDELTGVEFYPKEVSKCGLPAGSGWYGAGLTGHLIKLERGFDFQFIQPVNDASEFNIAYLNATETGKEPKQSLVNVKVGDSGTINTNKQDLTPAKKEIVYVYPGKTGYSLIVDYNTKEDKMEMQLVKLL